MYALLKINRAALLFGSGAALLTSLVLLLAPPQREVASLADFLVKLAPFLLATEAIARLRLDDGLRSVLARAAVPVVFLGFFCYFVPKIFFSLDYFPTVYVLILQATPYLILGLALAFRLGGGTSEHVRRLAWGMLLLMVSGIEDLAFLTVNNHTDPQWATIPERWTWASHMRVRLGHYPTKYEAFAFIAVHVLAAGLVLFAPVPWRWFRGARRDRAGLETAAGRKAAAEQAAR